MSTAKSETKPDADTGVFEPNADTVDRANKLVAAAGRAVIVDEDTFGKGGDVIKLMRSILNKIEAERVSWVSPLNAQVKRINDQFKLMKAPIETQITRVNGLLTAYANEQRRLAKVAADAAAAEAMEQAEKAEAAGQNHAAAELVEEAVAKTVAPVAPATVRGNYGSSSSMAKSYKCTVIDVDLIPEEYLDRHAPGEFSLKVKSVTLVTLNVPMIAAAVKSGKLKTPGLPGLKIEDDSKVVVR